MKPNHVIIVVVLLVVAAAFLISHHITAENRKMRVEAIDSQIRDFRARGAIGDIPSALEAKSKILEETDSIAAEETRQEALIIRSEQMHKLALEEKEYKADMERKREFDKKFAEQQKANFVPPPGWK